MGEGIGIRLGVAVMGLLLLVGVLAGGPAAQERPEIHCREPGDEAARAVAAQIKLDALADIVRGGAFF